MKRLISSILIMVLILTTVPMNVFNINANAATTKTKSEAVAWLDSRVGKKVGSGQCVALIKAYYEFLGAPTPYGNGCDYATNKLPAGWTRIKGGTPKKGDILVWTAGYKNYGHVAIYGGNNKYYHQNWNGEYVEILKKSYTSGFSISSGAYYAKYWGVIRPDFTTTSISYEDITSGQYFLRNKASGEYLTVANGKDADKAKINTSAFSNQNAQIFNIYQVKDGYEMMPLCSSTRVVNPYASTVESGKTVNLYTKSNDGTQWWKFQESGEGYVIRNVQNSGVCLTSASSDSLTVSTCTGADKQIWYLEKVCTFKYDANGGNDAPASQKTRTGYETVLSAKKPTRKCYKFLGWSTEPNDTVAVWTANSTVTIHEDTTVYAVWSAPEHQYQNGLCVDCGNGYTGLANSNGVWYYYRNGVVATDITNLIKYNGEWFYVVKGRVASEVTDLIKYNGEWFYVVKGKIASNTTTLVKYNGAWYYIYKGKLAGNTTNLIKYNGEWWYVVKGRVASEVTDLIKYNGEWWYVVKGKVASNTTTLVNYNGGWYYMVKGKLAAKTTTLVKYNGVWYYVRSGKVDFSYNGKVQFNGGYYNVRNGRVV